MKRFLLSLCFALVGFASVLVAPAPAAAAISPGGASCQQSFYPTSAELENFGPSSGGWSNAVSCTVNPSGMCAWVVLSTSPSGSVRNNTTAAHVCSPSCPPGSALNAQGTCDCQAGRIEQGGQCINPNEQCQAKSGTSEIINVTAGWARSPVPGGEWLITNKLSSGGTGRVCNGGCQQNFDANEPCPECDGYLSQVPNAQGLYRASVDFRGHYSGTACTNGPDDAVLEADDSKDPPCPGFVGEVNGVKGCYGTAEKPTRPVPPDPNLNKDPKKPGNPTAGTKPTSGPGSGSGGAGRTPGTGTGGSQGGPAGAAGTGSGDGTTDKPDDGKEQQNCGAPGQPPCKIDEAGTPNGSAQVQSLGGLKDAIKTFGDKAAQDVDKAKGLTSDGWTFTFALPTGCTPFVVEPLQVTLDVCQWQGIIHDLLTMVWLAVTVWCCVGMVGRTLQT